MATKPDSAPVQETVDMPPMLDLEAEDRGGACPECLHEASNDSSAFAKWLRMSVRKMVGKDPAPARCEFQPWDYDWQTADGPQCKCRHAFHGS